MKYPWTPVLNIAIGLCLTIHPGQAAEQLDKANAIHYRILSMEMPFNVEYSSRVKQYINSYVFSGKRETERMLGRSQMFFPMFEHYLKVYGLPDELKYIPLLESRLKPEAESEAGAAGLWQFIPETARQYRLTVNEYLDERKDPYKSTEAAMLMLSALYTEFQDWSLVLAAYNCGPGRVKRAIRLTGCDDSFWDIQHLLPQQTQSYVPAMIATIYVAKDYTWHELKPKAYSFYQKPYRVFKIYRSIDLEAIAHHCGMPSAELNVLNPGYLQSFIPASKKGHYLILPEDALPEFQQYVIKKSRAQTHRYAVAVLDSHSRPLPLQGLENYLLEQDKSKI
ncbi:MAG TPA: lytic transglycosylase domain-containing protein [Saprospiraceae bacterium]|nr:lytic transglycosylase domain-containing protein [Saprospiraceae bacterium]HMQ85296.1 lytic transglycosylase domain-containing protein [Saprospiraceae bacterium]